MNQTGNYLIEDIDMWNGSYRLTIIDQNDHREIVTINQTGTRLDDVFSDYSGESTIQYGRFDPSFLDKFPSNTLRRILRNQLNQHANDIADTYAFSGEGDSSQTEFESSSNQMKIGVHVPKSLVIPALFVLRAHVDKNWGLMESFLDYGIEEDEDDYPKDGDFLSFVSWSARTSFGDYGISGPVLSGLFRELHGPQGNYRVGPDSSTKVYTIADLVDTAFKDLDPTPIKSASKR